MELKWDNALQTRANVSMMPKFCVPAVSSPVALQRGDVPVQIIAFDVLVVSEFVFFLGSSRAIRYIPHTHAQSTLLRGAVRIPAARVCFGQLLNLNFPSSGNNSKSLFS